MVPLSALAWPEEDFPVLYKNNIVFLWKKRIFFCTRTRFPVLVKRRIFFLYKETNSVYFSTMFLGEAVQTAASDGESRVEGLCDIFRELSSAKHIFVQTV